MSQRQSFVLMAACGLVLSLASAPAAHAQGWMDMLQGYTGGRHYHGGNVLPNSWSVQRTVDSGIDNYYNELSRGVSSGRLTPGEASMLQGELNNIINMRNQFMADGGYSGAEANQMVAAFNRMNSLIGSQLNNSDVAGGAWYGRGGWQGPRSWPASRGWQGSPWPSRATQRGSRWPGSAVRHARGDWDDHRDWDDRRDRDDRRLWHERGSRHDGGSRHEGGSRHHRQ